MLFSGSLIKRYINIKDNPKNIANYLTLKACEIEEIIERKIPDEVVIWYVTKCEKHPDADKLVVTEVDCWTKWTYQIVTGAVNIAKDMYVPVALEGAYLPVKDLKIKPVNMRWIPSNGMICSKEELWIKEDLDIHWIWVLDEDINSLSKEDLGKKLSDEIPFLDNFIFDIDNKTLTNRPDLTWHLWQSIELSAIYNQFWKDKIFMSNINHIFDIFNNTNIFEILENSKKSDRDIFVNSKNTRTYLNLELNNVKIDKSKFKERLELIDLDEQPINNFVDFSNLFMLFTSQPIHFFDAKKINWNIVVEDAKWWEEFIDITWKKHILEEWDIIVKDNNKILALAWIIWWENSQVSENTTDIVVEIANFDPVRIRKTANRLNLRTWAKIRFEKDINPLFSLYSLILFLDQLKISWLDYEIWWLNCFYQEDVKKIYYKNIEIDFNDLRAFSWIDISNDLIIEILWKLWFNIVNENNYSWTFSIPFWRSNSDINIKEDVYEEVIRIYGYENIKWEEIMKNMDFVDYTPKVGLTRLVEWILVENYAFKEVETYPWFNLNIVNKIKQINPDRLFSLKNPVWPENKYLRANLCFNLLEVVEKNFREFDKINVFEVWKIFNQQEWEKLVLWVMKYQKEVNNWKQTNILELKNILKDILDKYGLKWMLKIDTNFEMLEKVAHPKQYGRILLNNQEIWFIATLHPYFHKQFKISENSQISYLQLDLEKLIDLKSKTKKKAIEKLVYYTKEDQIVKRDLSFVISKDKNYQDVLFSVWKVKEIIDVEVFDIYDLWDEKSISLTITIYGKDMKTEDINNVMDKAIKSVEKVGWNLR